MYEESTVNGLEGAGENEVIRRNQIFPRRTGTSARLAVKMTGQARNSAADDMACFDNTLCPVATALMVFSVASGHMAGHSLRPSSITLSNPDYILPPWTDLQAGAGHGFGAALTASRMDGDANTEDLDGEIFVLDIEPEYCLRKDRRFTLLAEADVRVAEAQTHETPQPAGHGRVLPFGPLWGTFQADRDWRWARCWIIGMHTAVLIELSDRSGAGTGRDQMIDRPLRASWVAGGRRDYNGGGLDVPGTILADLDYLHMEFNRPESLLDTHQTSFYQTTLDFFEAGLTNAD